MYPDAAVTQAYVEGSMLPSPPGNFGEAISAASMLCEVFFKSNSNVILDPQLFIGCTFWCIDEGGRHQDKQEYPYRHRYRY